MILTDHIHGLGKSATENWEMFDAICDKKTFDYARDYGMECTIIDQ